MGGKELGLFPDPNWELQLKLNPDKFSICEFLHSYKQIWAQARTWTRNFLK